MRIISGKFKGRRITTPRNLPVRPTTDMAKEALLNILNNLYNFSEVSVLDLFAGTGNISYEFGSRGAESIVSVDEDFGCTKFIRQTATEFGFPIQVSKGDVFKFLENESRSFDIIFADPPYDIGQGKFEQIVKMVFDRKVLSDEGLLIIEHSKRTSLEDAPHFSYRKNYGGNSFSFFELPKKS